MCLCEWVCVCMNLFNSSVLDGNLGKYTNSRHAHKSRTEQSLTPVCVSVLSTSNVTRCVLSDRHVLNNTQHKQCWLTSFYTTFTCIAVQWCLLLHLCEAKWQWKRIRWWRIQTKKVIEKKRQNGWVWDVAFTKVVLCNYLEFSRAWS